MAHVSRHTSCGIVRESKPLRRRLGVSVVGFAISMTIRLTISEHLRFMHRAVSTRFLLGTISPTFPLGSTAAAATEHLKQIKSVIHVVIAIVAPFCRPSIHIAFAR